jgi:hypothetical protein
MAFNAETKNTIESYVTAHIPDERWHRDFFSFVRNSVLAERLADEFLSARYLYKMLEDGKKIIPTYEALGRTDETKVRFDRKAECAFNMGFIEE